MDSFNQKDRSRLELELLAIELTKTCNKVILRHIHSLPRKKFQNVTLKIFMVNCLEIVEVELSVRKTRSIQTVHEIVVGRE